MDAPPKPRPPLPRPLRLVIAVGCVLFLLPLLLAAGVPQWPVLGVGIALVAVVMAAAFVMLREYFSRKTPRRRKRPQPPSAGNPGNSASKRAAAPLIALAAVLGITAPLSAHAIDRQTSFLLLDQAADLVAAVEVRDTTLSTATVEVLRVFRAPADAAPKPGETLSLRMPVLGIDAGRYVSGVAFCFATKGSKGWSVVSGPYMGSVRTRAEYDADGKLDFLGLLASPEQVRDALIQHPRLDPSLCPRLTGDSLAAARTALGLSATDPLPHTPLTDMRFPVHRDWIASGNPLLVVSALVDAYEIADALASRVGTTSLRPLPGDVVESLEATAAAGIASTNRHIQSAALAVFERVGFRQCPPPVLLAIAATKPGEHIPIVRCEAHRFLGEIGQKGDYGPHSDAIAARLAAGLLDETLRDLENDWVAEGIARLPKQGRTVGTLMKSIEPLLASEDWYDNEAAIRALIAIDDYDSNPRLHRAFKAESPGELRTLMLRHLATWPSTGNSALEEIFNSPDALAADPGELVLKAVTSVVLADWPDPRGETDIPMLIRLADRRKLALIPRDGPPTIDAFGEAMRAVAGDHAAMGRFFRTIAELANSDAAEKPLFLGDWQEALHLVMSYLPQGRFKEADSVYDAVGRHGYGILAALTDPDQRTRFVAGFYHGVSHRSNAMISMFVPQDDGMPHRQAALLGSANVQQTALMCLLDDHRHESPDWRDRFAEFLAGTHGPEAKLHAIQLAISIPHVGHRAVISGPPPEVVWKLNEESRALFIKDANLDQLEQWLSSPTRPGGIPRHYTRPLSPLQHHTALKRLVTFMRTACQPSDGSTDGPADTAGRPAVDTWNFIKAASALYYLTGDWKGYLPAASLDPEASLTILNRWEAHFRSLPIPDQE